MKKKLHFIVTFLLLLLLGQESLQAQAAAEWRLVNGNYSDADPDGGAGPATGTATFTLQVRSTSGTLEDISAITVGWSWQSANTMIPTTAGGTGTAAPGCTTPVNNPGNVVLSNAFTAAGYTYTTVNQCFLNTQSSGGQTFDRTVIGTLESSTNGIDLPTTWTDLFTVTLWTLQTTAPQGGYVLLNSTNLGAPGAFSNYELADILGNPYEANSLTFATPLALSGSLLPVQFTRFAVDCSPAGNTIAWQTAMEKDNSHFEVEKSSNGANWSAVGRINGTGSGSYQLTDKAGGEAQYRIKQVDLNGAVSYSGIVRSNCGNSAIVVNLYPKPAQDKLTLQVSSDRTINTRAHVIDNYGRVVMTIQLPVSKGNNTFLFNVGHLPQGQYYLRSTDENGIVNQRFTITR
ncbi:T9SS type A sorting domain-containing protein [Flavisolibacter sp. BT320]|nr:T9SS type A sorting domain-containing protein [Flavisolibacter longurius]